MIGDEMLIPAKHFNYNIDTGPTCILRLCLLAIHLVAVAVCLVLASHQEDRHVNQEKKHLPNQDHIFEYPFFACYGVSVSLFINRKTAELHEHDSQDPADRTTTEQKKLICICPTMYRENEEEMETVVSSIVKLLYCKDDRRNDFEFETHIFFDDAFEGKTRMRISRVTQLEEVIERELETQRKETIRNWEKYEYPTDYGRRLEWTTFTTNGLKETITVHLKDANLVRKKKRWSQVMYIHYLLSHKHKEKTNGEDLLILALDGDVDFEPSAVFHLATTFNKDDKIGAVCGRIVPEGGKGLMTMYQKFEYAASHWLQKSAENTFGCCLCSPGCFSLFSGKALLKVKNEYIALPKTAAERLKYDLGEDRWLCTLLLKKGYSVEYLSMASAKTFVPTSFMEFCKQRRRWTPSTLANIIDVIWAKEKINNHNISTLYLWYQRYLLSVSVLTPGTILLVLMGALTTAFPEIPLWASLLVNIVPVAALCVICLKTEKEELPIYFTAFMSTVYSVFMVILLIGLIVESVQSNLCSVSAMFFGFVVGVFVVAAVLHINEDVLHVVYGGLYFFAVPAVSMLMVIYILASLHNLSWGTREDPRDMQQSEGNANQHTSFWKRLCWNEDAQTSSNRGKPYFYVSSFTKRPIEGCRLILQCKPAATKICSVKWTKGTKKQREIKTGGGGRFTGGTIVNPSLTIDPVRKKDKGQYICEISNESGKVKKSVKYFDNISLGKISLTSSEKYLPTKNPDLCVDVRLENVKMEIKGVKWYKDNQEMNIGGRIKDGLKKDNLETNILLPYLKIENVDVSDAGCYICELTVTRESNGDNFEDMIQVSTTIESLSIHVDAPDVYQKNQDDTIICKVNYDATKKIYWNANNGPMENEASSQKQIELNSCAAKLKIEDGGKYTFALSDFPEIRKTVVVGRCIKDEEKEFWRNTVKEYHRPEDETLQSRKELRDMMISLRNEVCFLFLFVNIILIAVIFVMAQVNAFKKNIQITIPCPNTDGSYEMIMEPISMVFLLTFGLTLLLQLVGMIHHRFCNCLHAAAVTKVCEKAQGSTNASANTA